jgi:tight adherence protein B
MAIDATFILYVAVFLAAFLVIEGFYYLILDIRTGGRRAVNRRLRMLESGTASEEVLARLRRKPGASLSNKDRWNPVARLDSLIGQASLNVSVNRALALMGSASAALFLVISVYKHGFALWAVPASIAICVGLPLVYISRLKRKRLERFGEQLPDALDTMVRSLRVGHPIAAGMEMIAAEMADPIGTEFGIVVDEMTYGLDLQEALENMGRRIDQGDLKFMIVAMNIQHGTGGNLAEVLDGLSHVIRERFRTYRKIRALSSEGRMSAYILCGLPFVVLGGMMVINPKYYTEYAEDPVFLITVAIAFINMLIGIYAMYRLVNFRV